jgi:hypothetical protein
MQVIKGCRARYQDRVTRDWVELHTIDRTVTREVANLACQQSMQADECDLAEVLGPNDEVLNRWTRRQEPACRYDHEALAP